MSTDWVDAKEESDRIKFAPNVVVRMARRGEIPGHKLGGKWLFDPVEVDAWIHREKDPLRQSVRSRARRRA